MIDVAHWLFGRMLEMLMFTPPRQLLHDGRLKAAKALAEEAFDEGLGDYKVSIV